MRRKSSALGSAIGSGKMRGRGRYASAGIRMQVCYGKHFPLASVYRNHRSHRSGRQSMPRFFARVMLLTPASIGLLLTASVAALAADAIVLTIKNHRFTPTEVSVPAGERF